MNSLLGGVAIEEKQGDEAVDILSKPNLPAWMKVLMEDFVSHVDGQDGLRFSTNEVGEAFSYNDSNTSHRYWQKAHEATDIIDYLTANFDYVEISPVSNRNLAG